MKTQHKKMQQFAKAFTLIELLVVISILVLLASLGVGSIKLAYSNKAAQEGERELNNLVTLARSRAVANGAVTYVVMEANKIHGLDQEKDKIYAYIQKELHAWHFEYAAPESGVATNTWHTTDNADIVVDSNNAIEITAALATAYPTTLTAASVTTNAPMIRDYAGYAGSGLVCNIIELDQIGVANNDKIDDAYAEMTDDLLSGDSVIGASVTMYINPQKSPSSYADGDSPVTSEIHRIFERGQSNPAEFAIELEHKKDEDDQYILRVIIEGEEVSITESASSGTASRYKDDLVDLPLIPAFAWSKLSVSFFSVDSDFDGTLDQIRLSLGVNGKVLNTTIENSAIDWTASQNVRIGAVPSIAPSSPTSVVHLYEGFVDEVIFRGIVKTPDVILSDSSAGSKVAGIAVKDLAGVWQYRAWYPDDGDANTFEDTAVSYFVFDPAGNPRDPEAFEAGPAEIRMGFFSGKEVSFTGAPTTGSIGVSDTSQFQSAAPHKPKCALFGESGGYEVITYTGISGSDLTGCEDNQFNTSGATSGPGSAGDILQITKNGRLK